jgi:LuxR family maltose regulon positive regulatory protein
MPVAWLSLDSEDNDPVRFLTYLVAALQTQDPQLDVSVQALLEASQSPPLERVLTVLANDLAHRQAGDFVLVLDDYHVITVHSLHQALSFLLEHLPPQLHIVLASRTDPPFQLSRLRARGQLAELRAAELRLNLTETNTFLHTVMGLDLPTDAITALESRTEGWVAGLQLAGLSLRGRTDISTFLAAFTGSHRFVLDYLSEEVLSHQSAPVLTFLLQTSILERLCGSLCDAVTAQEGGQAMLEALELTNLFTVALDEERHWYRYHHLFAELLQRRLRETQPMLIPELHRRASLWYEQHGQSIEAVQHALAAQDIEHAARLMEQCALMLIGQGQTRMLLEWLNALPDTLMHERPLFGLCYAGVLHLNGQIDEAKLCLEDVERMLKTHTLPVKQTSFILGSAATIHANIARYSGDLAHYVALGQQALQWFAEVLTPREDGETQNQRQTKGPIFSQISIDLLPEMSLMMRVTSLMQLAYGYLVSGDVTASREQQVKVALTTARTSNHPLILLRCLTMLARMQVLQGRLREAAATYEEAGQATSGIQVLQVLTASIAYCSGLADLLRQWNRLDEAERLIAQGMELVSEKKFLFADDMMLEYLTLARLQLARGLDSAASTTLDTFLNLVETRHFAPHMKAIGKAMQAHIALLQGRLAEAIRWANESGLSPEDADLPYLYEPAYLVLVRVFIARGHENPAGPFLQNALHLLERLLSDAEAKARMGTVLEILILQSLALSARRNRTGAHTTLERALILAQPQGYIRLFVDEGTPMLILLREIQERGIVPDYIALLLSAFGAPHIPDTASSIPAGSPLLEPLTSREREVLLLLAEGASNREIASRLVLSTGTIKKYVYNICGKLGVQSRTQALARARTLHLL